MRIYPTPEEVVHALRHVPKGHRAYHAGACLRVHRLDQHTGKELHDCRYVTVLGILGASKPAAYIRQTFQTKA